MPLQAIIITTAVHCAIQSGGKWPPCRPVVGLHDYAGLGTHPNPNPKKAVWLRETTG